MYAHTYVRTYVRTYDTNLHEFWSVVVDECTESHAIAPGGGEVGDLDPVTFHLRLQPPQQHRRIIQALLL